jgi:hypothetical protein
MSFENFGEESVRIATADCSEEAGSGAGHEWVASNAGVLVGSGTVALPVAFCPAPSLQYHGYLEWTITGTLNVTGVSNIGFRLLDAGGAISGVTSVSMATAGSTGGAGRIICESKLMVHGSHDQVDMQTLRVTITVLNADGSVNATLTGYRFAALAQRSDHQLGFSFTSDGSSSATAAIQSVTCKHVAQRSVS